METLERRIEKEYLTFKNSFRLKYTSYLSAYLYPNKSRQTESHYNNIIQQYHTRHKKLIPSHKTIIKALSLESKRLLKGLPEELREKVRALTPTRANDRHSGNQAFRRLWQFSKDKNSNFSKYYDAIVQYYVISTHILELKRYASQAEQKLKCTSAFPLTYAHSRILQWYNHLLPVVRKIRFKNEWFAIYYSMKHCLRAHSMHAFADMMNQWFPHCKVPCSYDAMSDYNFLTTISPDQWLIAPIATKTKATSRGILRVHTFLTTHLPHPFDPIEQHFLF